MDAIIVTIISGFFSLAAIWYQNHLQKLPKAPVYKSNQDQVSEIAHFEKKWNPIWRITFTIFVVACPLLLLLLIGKERLFGGDKYLMEYYFIWVLIIFTATILGWKKKTLFEKIILIASLIFLIYMTLLVMYETKRNASYRSNLLEHLEFRRWET